MGKPVVAGAPSREPQQGRSRASFERMLAAAEKLMVRNGSDDFTLADVGKAGKVSIGSIYLRFDSKDDLIHAVQSRVLERVEADQQAMLARVVADTGDLDDFLVAGVAGFAETLRRHAPILRPIMLRASYDRAVSGIGKVSHARFATSFKQAMLAHRASFGGGDHVRKVDSAFGVIYATLARFLGLGSSSESAAEGDWDELKVDLAVMCAAFLRHA